MARYILSFNIIIVLFNVFYVNEVKSEESINVPIILDQLSEIQVSNFLPDKKSIPTSLYLVFGDINKLKQEDPNCGKKLLLDLDRTHDRAFNDEITYLGGLIQESCGRYEESNKLYRNSLQLHNGNTKLIFRLAVVSYKLEKFEDAVNYLNEAKWRGYTPAHIGPYLRGLIFLKQNKAEDASNSLTLSKKLNPNFVPAIKTLRALKHYQISKIIDPSKREKLELEYLNLGAELLAKDPDNRQLAIDQTRFLFTAGDSLKSPSKLAEAISICDKYITKSNYKDETFVILKVGILKKQSKTVELANLISKVEEAKALTPQLRAIKDSLEQ